MPTDFLTGIFEEANPMQSQGDTITARHLYQKPVSFPATHKLWLAANHPPKTFDLSKGFWRRVFLVPFRASFNPPHEHNPEDPLDRIRERPDPERRQAREGGPEAPHDARLRRRHARDGAEYGPDEHRLPGPCTPSLLAKHR